jgi:hypothetical protein
MKAIWDLKNSRGKMSIYKSVKKKYFDRNSTQKKAGINRLREEKC